ncbi:MAG: type II secretion system F family protein [Candidatus Cloacimonetes bacterium]|nr:type II secretion system F family protein [Candidatus Cloacimonadota bacterium]
MKKEYRYQGVSSVGKPVQGIVVAKSKSKAKKRIKNFAAAHDIRIKSIKPKKRFIYKVKLPNGKKIKGKQEAFTKDEVEEALQKIGYRNIKVQPVLIDFRFKPSFDDILNFINLSSFMLKEQMDFSTILRLLAKEQSNKTLEDTLKKIERALKKGEEGTKVFKRYEDVFGKFPAYMMGLATKSGNISKVFEATAKFMERDREYKKSLKKALLTPALTVIAMIAAILYYVIKIFPATAELFQNFDIELPPLTAATLKASHFFGANWWWMALAVIIPIIIFAIWTSTEKGKVWKDKTIINLPVMGHLLHKSSIEIFFRIFAVIYSGSENNIETIRISSEACRNAYIEHGIKTTTIPLMLKKGESLVPAFEKAEVFNEATLSRLKTGTETGNVLKSAQQISGIYEKETTYKMGNIIDSIQSIIGIFIAIAITALTIVSAEIATVSPPTPGM